MLEKIKKYSLILSGVSVVFPIVTITKANLNLMIFNFGYLGLFVALLIAALSFHNQILPKKLLDSSKIISFSISVVNLILMIVTLIVTIRQLSKLNTNDFLKLVSSISKFKLILSWGWIPLFLGVIVAILIDIFILVKETKKENLN